MLEERQMLEQRHWSDVVLAPPKLSRSNITSIKSCHASINISGFSLISAQDATRPYLVELSTILHSPSKTLQSLAES